MPANTKSSCAIVFDGCGITMTPTCKELEMIAMFARVPSPGFSLSGIHSNNTRNPMMKVVHPIVRPVRTEKPSARTVQGPLPRPDCTTSASPVPKSHRPNAKTARVVGRVVQRRSERQRVTGTVRAGASHRLMREMSQPSLKSQWSSGNPCLRALLRLVCWDDLASKNRHGDCRFPQYCAPWRMRGLR